MSAEDRDRYVRSELHREFRRDDYLPRLAEHAGIASGDEATQQQWDAYGRDRRAAAEARYDRHPVRGRVAGAVNRVRERLEVRAVRDRGRGRDEQ